MNEEKVRKTNYVLEHLDEYPMTYQIQVVELFMMIVDMTNQMYEKQDGKDIMVTENGEMEIWIGGIQK